MEYFEIAGIAQSSDDFRRVRWSGQHTQLAVMTIPQGGEIGLETHEHDDRILQFLSGVGEAFVGGRTRSVMHGDLVIVPAGIEHNQSPELAGAPPSTLGRVLRAVSSGPDPANTGPNPLVLTTIDGPPDHADGVVHRTKEEADAAEAAGEDERPAAG